MKERRCPMRSSAQEGLRSKVRSQPEESLSCMLQLHIQSYVICWTSLRNVTGQTGLDDMVGLDLFK